jgi:hypothetical protein
VSYNEKTPIKIAPKSNDFKGCLNDVRMFRALHITPEKAACFALENQVAS